MYMFYFSLFVIETRILASSISIVIEANEELPSRFFPSCLITYIIIIVIIVVYLFKNEFLSLFYLLSEVSMHVYEHMYVY